MEKKRCTKCKDPKELGEFYRCKSGKDGKHSWCKACLNILAKERYRDNPEKARARIRKRRAENPEKTKVDRKKEYRENPERSKDRRLVREYGITLVEYYEMVEAQKGRCAMCGEILEMVGESLPPVDHDHSMSGRESIRGIVHRKCNLFLGYVEENPKILTNVREYLRLDERVFI